MAEAEGRGRTDFLRSRHETELREAVSRREPNSVPTEDAPSVFDAFLAADPTPAKRYLQWLVRRYLSSDADPAFRFEDLGRIRDLLAAFDRWKHHLPVEQRDIGRCRTEIDLLTVVEPILERLGKAEDDLDRDHPLEKRLAEAAEKRRAMEGTDVLFDAEGWLLVRIVSADAAAWWARGTRWCTSDASTFESYRCDGPLVVLVAPHGKRIQMHFGHRQVMDERDAPVAIPTRSKAGPVPEGLRAAFVAEVASTGDPRAWTCLPEPWIPDEVYATSWRLLLGETTRSRSIGGGRKGGSVPARLVRAIPRRELTSLMHVREVVAHVLPEDLDAATVASLCRNATADGTAVFGDAVAKLLGAVGIDLLVAAARHGPMWPERLRKAGLELDDDASERLYEATRRHRAVSADGRGKGSEPTLSDLPQGLVNEETLLLATRPRDLGRVAEILEKRPDLDASRVWSTLLRTLGPVAGIPAFPGHVEILVETARRCEVSHACTVLAHAARTGVGAEDIGRILDVLTAEGYAPEDPLGAVDPESPGFAAFAEAVVTRRSSVLVTHADMLPKELTARLVRNGGAGLAGVLAELEADPRRRMTKRRVAEIVTREPDAAILMPLGLLPKGYHPTERTRPERIRTEHGEEVLRRYLDEASRNLAGHLPPGPAEALGFASLHGDEIGTELGLMAVHAMDELISGRDGAAEEVGAAIERFCQMLDDRAAFRGLRSFGADDPWSDAWNWRRPGGWKCG